MERNVYTRHRTLGLLLVLMADIYLFGACHADPRSAKFAAHWWEFDVGWYYIRLLDLLGLAEVVYARTESPEEFAAGRYD